MVILVILAASTVAVVAGRKIHRRRKKKRALKAQQAQMFNHQQSSPRQQPPPIAKADSVADNATVSRQTEFLPAYYADNLPPYAQGQYQGIRAEKQSLA